MACGAVEDFPPSSTGPANVPRGPALGPDGADACSEEGATRPCEATLTVEGQTVLCIDGVQLCSGGEWSDCKQKSMKRRRLKKGAFADLGLGPDVNLEDLYDRGGQPKYTVLSADAGAMPCLSPCSPSCQEFDETPSFTLMGTPIPSGPITTGGIANVPGGLLAKAYVASGCTEANDCQFGYYCSDPVTSSSCAHSVCATGRYLGSSCDPDTSGVGTGNPSIPGCVQQICASASTAYCCQPPGVSLTGTVDITQPSLYYQSASHPGSLLGRTLQLNVDGAGATTLTFTSTNVASEAALLAAVDAQWPALTATQGGPNGNQLVLGEPSGTIVLTATTGSTTLGLTNPVVTSSHTGWDAGCVQAVHDVCGGYCLASGGSCAHSKCYTGDALASGCSACVTTICNAHPECCGAGGGTWTSACVGYVAALCSASAHCPSARGACAPWASGQTDPSCNGVDLYLGVPCTYDNTVPVCNAGTQPTSGASFSIVGFASNSGAIPALPPACGSNGCLKHVCVAASGTVIPAGGCVNVPCGAAQGGPFGLNEQLYVNPPQVIAAGNGTTTTLTTSQMPECDYANDWSINAGGACATIDCAPIEGTLTPAQVNACSFALPPGAGTIWDMSNPVVQYTTAGSTTENNVPFVSGPIACDPTAGGFYYDSDASPSSIELCPATCAAVAMAGTTTTYSLSCPSTYTSGSIPLMPFSAPFTGAGACPPGTRAQWDYLAYDAITPGPSTITFQAQTGPTATTFDNPLVLLATAHSTPTDTQYCPLGALPSMGGSCPVDVFDALNKGSPNGPSQEPYLNLVITLKPTQMVAPTLNGFQLTYSCASSE